MMIGTLILGALLIVGGYLIGSICSAIIVCQACGLPDPRKTGSNNPGATNVLRIAGKKYAALVLVGDVLKGTLPVLLAKLVGAQPMVIACTLLAAVVGHMYPVFFQFKGGKGVATAIGALLGFHFIVGVMTCATWLLVAKFTRYSSLASILAIILTPFYVLILVHQPSILTPLFLLVILILSKHRDNITRLFDGTEAKINLSKNMLAKVMNENSPISHTDSDSEK
jgi:glycerol-3-phosphate acyltransferase PlsY